MTDVTLYATGGAGLASPIVGPEGVLYATSSQSGEILAVTNSGISPVVNTSGMPTVCTCICRWHHVHMRSRTSGALARICILTAVAQRPQMRGNGCEPGSDQMPHFDEEFEATLAQRRPSTCLIPFLNYRRPSYDAAPTGHSPNLYVNTRQKILKDRQP
eukprot:scaffold74123_cov44-Tisochrysis_lutea.AAC.1